MIIQQKNLKSIGHKECSNIKITLENQANLNTTGEISPIIKKLAETIVGKTKDNIRLKYNNETIDKELNVLSNSFSNNWRKKTNSIQKKWNNYLKQRYE